MDICVKRCQVAVWDRSILGPLFFILYVNDVFKQVTYCKILTMYADDTILIEQGPSRETSESACQKTLNEVHAGCNLKKLTVNINKTKSMLKHYGSRVISI